MGRLWNRNIHRKGGWVEEGLFTKERVPSYLMGERKEEGGRLDGNTGGSATVGSKTTRRRESSLTINTSNHLSLTFRLEKGLGPLVPPLMKNFNNRERAAKRETYEERSPPRQAAFLSRKKKFRFGPRARLGRQDTKKRCLREGRTQDARRQALKKHAERMNGADSSPS